ncbi:hypothetical protein COTS27_00414 [Spirochaetota bacterium]|nr:hypothetical protein COTS27_00414 [Spirochaetota bacterium]
MGLVWASVLGGSLYVCLGERGAADKGNLLHLVAASTPSLPSTEKETGATIESGVEAVRWCENYYIKQVYRFAMPWCREAALTGDAASQYRLGRMFAEGKSVPRDDERAFMWIERAAKQKYAKAQYHLGKFYEMGTGTTQSIKQAYEWYLLAAYQGNAAAQYHLGELYGTGVTIPLDFKKAISWYEKAANQGYAAAEYKLGLKYENGDGLPQDDTKATFWYEKAAEHGHPTAQYKLGKIHFTGQGVEQSDIEAYKWVLIYKANVGLYPDYKRRVKAKFSPRELIEPQKRAQAWLKKYAR